MNGRLALQTWMFFLLQEGRAASAAIHDLFSYHSIVVFHSVICQNSGFEENYLTVSNLRRKEKCMSKHSFFGAIIQPAFSKYEIPIIKVESVTI